MRKLILAMCVGSTIIFMYLLVTNHIRVEFHPRPAKYLTVKETKYELTMTTIDYEDLFRQVTPSVFVHSAYWDTRQKPFAIQVLVLAPKIHDHDEQTLECNIHYERANGSTYERSRFEKTVIENCCMDYTFIATFYRCKTSQNNVPIAVAIVPRNNLTDNIQIPKHNTVWKNVQPLFHQNPKQREELAICVKPIHSNYNETMRIAAFISYYQHMGASYFIFTDYGASPHVKELIKRIQDAEITNLTVDLQKWNAPEDVFYYGEVATHQYCYLKLMSKYKYVAMVDFDEFIVPSVKYDSILQLVKHFDQPTYGSFRFKGNHFCFGNATNKVRSIFSDVKEDKTSNTKVIVKPEAAKLILAHKVKTHFGPYIEKLVDPKEALMHHYRVSHCTSETVTYKDDSFYRRYGAMIRKSPVLQIWKQMSHTENSKV